MCLGCFFVDPSGKICGMWRIGALVSAVLLTEQQVASLMYGKKMVLFNWIQHSRFFSPIAFSVRKWFNSKLC